MSCLVLKQAFCAANVIAIFSFGCECVEVSQISWSQPDLALESALCNFYNSHCLFLYKQVLYWECMVLYVILGDVEVLYLALIGCILLKVWKLVKYKFSYAALIACIAISL